MENLTNIFKALSDETRLRMLKLLENGELCVCDITAALDMVQPKVSFHLRILKQAGLIKDRKQGKWIHYSIDDADMFGRFLIFLALEKIPADAVMKNKAKLNKFLKNKRQAQNCRGVNKC